MSGLSVTSEITAVAGLLGKLPKRMTVRRLFTLTGNTLGPINSPPIHESRGTTGERGDYGRSSGRATTGSREGEQR